MGLSKGPSSWSVEEVLEWIQEQYPTKMTLLHKAVIKHDITGTTHAWNSCFSGRNFTGQVIISFPRIILNLFLYTGTNHWDPV